MSTAPKANILLVLMDDQRNDSLGFMGSPEVETPFLDTLSAAGATLTNCFVTTPICTPGRAEIFTGCDSFQNEVPWFSYPIKSGLKLLPEAFREKGWNTAYFGKWHNDGHPSERGFAFTRRVMFDARDYFARHSTRGHDLIFDEPAGEVRGHSTELFTDVAVEWLDEQKDAAKPWFACLAYHSPHDPFQPPEPFASRYGPDTARIPANFSPVHPIDNGDLTIRDELNLPWPRTPDGIRKYRSAYHGMVAHHDACIGRVLETLRKNGQSENTYVVFTSDHGLAVGCHGLLGKENMYDHSTRVPLVFSGPGILSGQRQELLCRNTDIYPTLCGLAGIPIPESVQDGRDLSRALTASDNRAFRESVFSQLSSPQNEPDATGFLPLKPTQRMVRTQRWKLIFYPQIAHFQLFDLSEDPEETVDLLSRWLYRAYSWGRKPNPQHAYQPESGPETALAAAAKMRELMKKHMVARNDDALPLFEQASLDLHH